MQHMKNMKPLAQALIISRLDHYSAPLSVSMIKPMQMIQNTVADLVSTPPDVTPFASSCGQNQNLRFDCGFQDCIWNCTSTYKQHLVPSQRGTRTLFKTFTLSVPLWWIELPTSTPPAETTTTFQKTEDTAFPSAPQCVCLDVYC